MLSPAAELPALLGQSSLQGKADVASSDAHSSVQAKESPRRAAVVSVSLKGHQRLALAIASELLQQGLAVDFLIDAAGESEQLTQLAREQPLFKLHAIKEGKEHVGHMDWQYVASSTGRIGGSKVALFEQIAQMNDPELFREALVQWRAMIRILTSIKPDILICDHAQRTIQLWGEDNDVPGIILHTPYFPTTNASGCAKPTFWQEQRLKRVMRTLKPLDFLEAAHEELGIGGRWGGGLVEGAAGARQAKGCSPHTFVFCEPELLNSDVRSLPDRVHVVGPCFPEAGKSIGSVEEDLQCWLDGALAQGQSVLYVAMGTLANGFLTTKAVTQMLQAFKALGSNWKVLWSLPKAQQALIEASGGSAQQGLCVKSFVAQRAVLEHPAVRVFLTHGGQSSVNEGIFAGVPLVCTPLFCDQYEVADAVEKHGLGIVFHKDELVSFWGTGGKQLAEAVRRADEEPDFRRAVARHGQLMRLRSGCKRAAEVVKSIIEGGPDYQDLWKPKVAQPGSCSSGLLACFQGVRALIDQR